MPHLSVSDILAGARGQARSPEAERHLLGCVTCRRLAGLTRPLEDPPVATDEDLAAPPIVDETYYVREQEVLGRGGMGRTFRARDRRLGRRVALKQPLTRAEVDDPLLYATMRLRFEREARVTARLEHPAIVGVYEAGRFPGGEPFYAMRLVGGTPLGRELAGRRSLVERLRLLPSLITVADALAYAHSRGIYHRDVKPDNILCGEFGEVVLIDWGLATELEVGNGSDGDAPSSATAVPGPGLPLTEYGVGTPAYMPPEQAAGVRADARADVYALGATLYHLLAGHPPYGETSSEEARARLIAGPPPPLTEVAPEVPAPLATLVERAMARDAGARFPTAAALAEELRRFQAGQLVGAHRYTPGQLVRHFARRYRGPLAIVGAALVAVGVLGAIAVRRVVRERDRADDERDRASASAQVAQARLRVAEGVTASQLAGAPEHRLEALTLGVQAVGASLAAHQPPGREALQGLIDALSAGPIAAPVVGNHASPTYTKVTRDGARLYTADEGQMLRAWDVPSGRLAWELALGLERPQFGALSADQQSLVACSFNQRVAVVDLVRREVRHVDVQDERWKSWCGFLPDGDVVIGSHRVRRYGPDGALRGEWPLPAPASWGGAGPRGGLALGLLDGQVVWWPPDAGAPRTAPAHRGLVQGIAFDPTGDVVYSSGADRHVRVWHRGQPAPAELAVLPGESYPEVALADGARVAVVAHGVGLRGDARASVLLDVAGHEPPLSLPAMQAAALTDDGGVWAIASGAPVLVDGASGRVRTRLAPRDRVFTLARAGATLFSSSADGEGFLWDVRSSAAAGQLLGHTGEIVAIEAGPGGALLSASIDGTARLWDLATGGSVVLDVGPAMLLAASWSPDHQQVLALDENGVASLFDRRGARRWRSPDGEPLATAGFSVDGAAVLGAGRAGAVWSWDVGTGARTAVATDLGPITRLLPLVDDRLAIGGLDGAVRLLEHGRVRALAPAPDDPMVRGGIERLATIGDRVIVTYSGAPSALLALTAGASDARELAARALTSSGDRVITGAADGGVWAFAADGALRQKLTGHRRAITSAALAADGTLATGDAAGEVRIWDADGSPRLVLAARDQGAVTALGFADDATLVIGHSAGALRVVPVTATAALARGCALLAYFGRADDVADRCP